MPGWVRWGNKTCGDNDNAKVKSPSVDIGSYEY